MQRHSIAKATSLVILTVAALVVLFMSGPEGLTAIEIALALPAVYVCYNSSENSNRSSNVAKEVSIADKYGKVIIPVRLDNSPMNPKMDYDLAGIDFVDLFSFDEHNTTKLKNAILGQLAMNNSL